MAFCIQKCAKTPWDKFSHCYHWKTVGKSVFLSEGATVTKGGGAYRQVRQHPQQQKNRGGGGCISPVFKTRPVLFTLNMNKSTTWPLIFMRETSYCDSEINVSKHGEISHVYETRIISHLAKLTAGRLLSRCLSCLNPIYSILYREDTVWQSWFCRHSREMRDQVTSSDRVNYGAVIALAAISKLRIVWQLWNLNYNLYLK